jgi:ubiquinone/menaquinone biosynthesis C-methylase UbiE
MERIPEPDLMNDDEQARAYAHADFEEPHEAFVDEFARRFEGLDLAGHVLDLGCGPADISMRFARRYAACEIDGVDGAEAMLKYGHVMLEREGLADRVHLHRAYLPDETPPQESYDAIISNSLLHHLDDPSVIWTSIKRFAKPGAPIFVMDLMRPADRAEAERFVALYADGEPDVLRHDFFHSLLAAYRPAEVSAQLEAAGLGHLEVVPTSDRHLIVFGRAR